MLPLMPSPVPPAVLTRRSIAYALLSLLLVLSQQMGISHALSHWPDGRQAERVLRQVQNQQQNREANQEQRRAKSLPLEQSCAQCLAFAQIGSALDSPFHVFPSTHAAASAVSAIAAQPACRRRPCVYQSRAPPILT